MLTYLIFGKLEKFKKNILSTGVRSWLSKVIIWKGTACICICMSRMFDQKADIVHKLTIVFSRMYYLLFTSFDYGSISFVGFTLTFILIASAYNYYSYVF